MIVWLCNDDNMRLDNNVSSTTYVLCRNIYLYVYMFVIYAQTVFTCGSVLIGNSAKWRDAKGKLRSVLRCARILCSVQMGLCLLYLLWQINFTFVGYNVLFETDSTESKIQTRKLSIYQKAKARCIMYIAVCM